jgi:hypothetical protein
LVKKKWRPKRNRTREDEIQISLFSWLGLYPDVRRLSFHIPNGGNREIQEAVKLKAMGVTAGVPDIFIAIPRGDFHGLFLELKTEHGVVSEGQRNFLYAASQEQYCCKVTYSLDAAIQAITEYLGDRLDRRKTVEGDYNTPNINGHGPL